VKLLKEILGRLLYVIIGAIIAPIVFTILFPPKHPISPPIQSKNVAELLARGMKQDPNIFLSPESLDAFIRKQNDLNQKYFTSGNLLLAVISGTDREKSIFLLSPRVPREGFYAIVDSDGKAILNHISQTNK
jgi:hypothetical protein